MSKSKHPGRRTEYSKMRSIMAKLDNQLNKEKQERMKETRKKAVNKRGKKEEELEDDE